MGMGKALPELITCRLSLQEVKGTGSTFLVARGEETAVNTETSYGKLLYC